VAVVVSGKPGAYALTRAERAGVPTACLEKKRGAAPEAYDQKLLEHLAAYDVDLVVTAGFLTIFGQAVVDAYPNRIINVHPALIPSFCGVGCYGLRPHELALAYGVKVTGATTHFVTAEADAGPIILQKAVAVLPDDTPESLQQRVMREAEWVILPESIRLYSEGRLRTEGRRVTVLPGADAGTAR
jgi:phosphoribosylglycinamide formyltransferase-1